MNGCLVVAARDALGDGPGEQLLARLRTCVTASRTAVLVLVDSLGEPRGGPPASTADGPPVDEPRPALLVVGAPPPYDGRPLPSLLLTAPRGPEEVALLTAWLSDEGVELVDLPLALAGLLVSVPTVAPRMVHGDSATSARWGADRDSA